MNLSVKMKAELINEIRFVTEQMKKTSIATEKLYFFSAVYGVAQRILNFEYDPELAFLHQVSVMVYNAINARIGATSKMQETPVSVPKNLFEKLEESIEKIAFGIENDSKIYLQLEKMANLAYSTTGNGYYLYLKGMLKL